MGDSKIGDVSSEGDGRRSVADPSIEVKVCTVRATIQAERLPSEHSPFSKQTILVDEVCSTSHKRHRYHPTRGGP